MSVAANRLSTTGSPIVRFGTKCASMTSTGNQSAPSTTAASWASRAKSAASIDGAISGRSVLPDMALSLVWRRSALRQHGSEHGVGAVPVWPQLDVGPLPQIWDRFEQRPDVHRR